MRRGLASERGASDYEALCKIDKIRRQKAQSARAAALLAGSMTVGRVNEAGEGCHVIRAAGECSSRQERNAPVAAQTLSRPLLGRAVKLPCADPL